jgi:hypothetical protein
MASGIRPRISSLGRDEDPLKQFSGGQRANAELTALRNNSLDLYVNFCFESDSKKGAHRALIVQRTNNMSGKCQQAGRLLWVKDIRHLFGLNPANKTIRITPTT